MSSYVSLVLTAGALLVPVLVLPEQARPLNPRVRRQLDNRLLLVVGCFVFGVLAQSILIPLLGIAVVLVRPKVTSILAKRRRARRLLLSWPDTLEVIAMGVSVGLSFDELLQFVIRCCPGATRYLFEQGLASLRAGSTSREALLGIAHHGGEPVRSVVDVMIAAERDGASVALLLDRLASESGRVHQLAAEERARRAPVLMLAPLTLCSLPAVLIGTIVPFVLLTFGQTSF